MESLGRDERPPAHPVIAMLLRAPYRFDLFQAISLLERQGPRDAEHGARLAVGDGQGESVRLSGHVALGFQPSDIHSVKARGPLGAAATGQRVAPTYILATQAMTLAGGQGPLPQPYTELLLERLAERDYAMRDFLDIFNHRFIGFLFRGRKKHAPALNWESLNASPLAACVRSIAHFRLVGEENGVVPWLRHAGLMTAAPRSMTGLLSLLADRFGMAVRGRQFVGGWLPLDARSQMPLGRGAALDGLRALGRRVWDQTAVVDIAFHGVNRSQLRQLLPTGDMHRSLSHCVKRYLSGPIDVNLVIEPATTAKPAARLGGGNAAQLGWTSWLRDGEGDAREMGATQRWPAPAAQNIQPVRMRL